MTQPNTSQDSASTRTARFIAAANLFNWARMVGCQSLADAAQAIMDRMWREERS